MPETATTHLDQIHALLASKRYSVTEIGNDGLRIQDVDSGISIRAVLEGDILFLSLVCVTAPQSANGISTSYFQLYDTGDGNIAVTLNNFCKLQDMGPDDEDDILSCVTFLMADVIHARDLIGPDLQAAAGA
jgi:hypothetical protein